jgi:hypothetical protein
LQHYLICHLLRDSLTQRNKQTGLADVVSITAGTYHACALTSAGVMSCWGRNTDGQIGDGTFTSPRTAPVTVMTGVAFMDAGEGHTCFVLTSTGAASCVGRNAHKQLGNNGGGNLNVPVMLGFSEPVAGLAVGYAFTCVSFPGGNVKCVGSDTYGALGNDAPDSGTVGSFVDVAGITAGPTMAPTTLPTMGPTMAPTLAPTTLAPTSAPTTAAPGMSGAGVPVFLSTVVGAVVAAMALAAF